MEGAGGDWSWGRAGGLGLGLGEAVPPLGVEGKAAWELKALGHLVMQNPEMEGAYLRKPPSMDGGGGEGSWAVAV